MGCEGDFVKKQNLGWSVFFFFFWFCCKESLFLSKEKAKQNSWAKAGGFYGERNMREREDRNWIIELVKN